MRDIRTERDTERGWRDTDRNRETERVEMKRQRKTAETERQGRQREIGRQRETARRTWGETNRTAVTPYLLAAYFPGINHSPKGGTGRRTC